MNLVWIVKPRKRFVEFKMGYKSSLISNVCVKALRPRYVKVNWFNIMSLVVHLYFLTVQLTIGKPASVLDHLLPLGLGHRGLQLYRCYLQTIY